MFLVLKNKSKNQTNDRSVPNKGEAEKLKDEIYNTEKKKEAAQPLYLRRNYDE